MAWAQIVLSIVFLLFTFAVTIIYELGFAHLTADQDKAFSTSINWLQGAALIIVYFWFQRQRTAGIPDASQVITQTHTAADGTKTVTTTPIIPTPSGATTNVEIPAATVAIHAPPPTVDVTSAAKPA